MRTHSLAVGLDLVKSQMCLKRNCDTTNCTLYGVVGVSVVSFWSQDGQSHDSLMGEGQFVKIGSNG